MNLQKLSIILFWVGISFFAFFLFSIGYGLSIQTDDWYLFANWQDDFYSIFNIGGHTYQRGRHIGDILVTIPPKIFAIPFISLGADPLNAIKICCAIFYPIYIMGGLMVFSYFCWFFMGQKNFKLIFLILALFCLPILIHAGSQYATMCNLHYTYMAAYTGSAFLSVLIWLPFAYFWAFEKEMSCFQINRRLAYSIWGILLYLATFSYEATTIPLSALSLAMLIYLFINRKKIHIPKEIYAYLGLFIVLSTLAFLLTFMGGRGTDHLNQLGGMSDHLGRAISAILSTPKWIAGIVGIGMFYSLFVFCKWIFLKKIEKLEFISFSLITIGVFSSLFFIAILGGYYLSLYFVFIGILLPVLSSFQQNKYLACILIPLIILSFSLRSCSSYLFGDDEHIPMRSIKKQDRKLLELYIEADKNNQEEIIIESSDPFWADYKMENDAQGNREISYWMDYYYTRNYIRLVKK